MASQLPALVETGDAEVEEMGLAPSGTVLNPIDRCLCASHMVLINETGHSLVVTTHDLPPMTQLKSLAAKFAAGSISAEVAMERYQTLMKSTRTAASTTDKDVGRVKIALDGPSRLTLQQNTLGADGKVMDRWYSLFTPVFPGKKYTLTGEPAKLATLFNSEMQKLVNELVNEPAGAAAAAAGAGAGPAQ